MSALSSIQHGLSFVLRFDDHFLGRAVPESFPVRIAKTLQRPAKTMSGSYRHEDGSYRFLDLPAGDHEVTWVPPLAKSTDHWSSFEAPLVVSIPAANPASLIRRELWPTAAAPAPDGMTCVRGKLSGPNNIRRRVTIQSMVGTPSSHFTISNDTGEFLFLIPAALPLTSDGMVELTASVDASAITGGQLHPAGASFVGPDFQVTAGKTSRIVFTLS